MMESLLSQPEGKTLEFKRDLSSPKPLLKTLVAFANSAGGRLVIGVDDSKRLLNALVHADYSHRGTPIRVAFFDNRIEVESPGLLLPSLTIEDIKQGVSQIRNPVIARMFRELDLIEQWGSGIPGIFRQAAADNLPEPTIEELAGRVRFTVPLQEILPLTREQSRKGDLAPVTDPVQRLVLALAAGELAPSELWDRLGLKHRPTFRENYLRPAIAQGLIEPTLPHKPNSRLQKYRLTAKGRGLVGSRP